MPDRNINDLCPAVRLRLERLQAAAAHAQVGFEVIFTLRSEEEQLALYAQGRKTLEAVNRLRRGAGMPLITEEQNKKPVTWELTSMHIFGCAFDVVLVKNGAAVWEDCPEWQQLGALGESVGFTWGGRWRVRDLGHFQYTGGLSLAALKEGKRPAA